MTDTQASATVTGIIQAYDKVKGYFDGYQPDKRSVTYDYRNRTAEMMVKITVPNNYGRKFRIGDRGIVKIPLEEGFRFVDMFSASDFESVRTPWSKTDTHWEMDPVDLPTGDNYLVRLEKTGVGDDIFNKIVDFSMPRDPIEESGDDMYYIQSAITEPRLFEDVYEEFRVDNVDVEVKVAVRGCFSTAIPERIPKSIRRSQRLLRASNQDDIRELQKIHRLRKGTRDAMEVSEAEAVQMIRSLASPNQFGDFIEVTSPYRREDIVQGPQDQDYLPENVNVDVSTNLDLDQRAAKGKLKFFKSDYTDFIENKTRELE